MRIAIVAILALFLLAASISAGVRWMPASLQSDPLGAPIITPAAVMALTKDGRLEIYDLRQGNQQTRYMLSSSAHLPPLLDGQNAFFATDDGHVEALDIIRMRRLWIYPQLAAKAQNKSTVAASTTGAVQSEKLESEMKQEAALDIRAIASGGGLVYIIDKNKVIALDKQAGRPRFNLDLLEDGGPAAADLEHVYVMDKNVLKAISANGKLEWEYKAGPLFKTKPAVGLGTVYIASTEGRIDAIDAKTGRLNWSYSVNGWPMATPFIDGQRVIIGTNDGRLLALDAANGKVLWSTDIGAEVWGEMALAFRGGERIVLVPTQAPSLAAVDIENGKVLWNYRLPDWPASPAADSEGTYAAITTRDRKLFLFAISPMCTIESPIPSQPIGPYPTIKGLAWAWGGASRVQLEMAGRSVELPVGKDGAFTYEPDLADLKDGAVPIKCLAVGKEGQVEVDAGMPKSAPMLALLAAQEQMEVVAPKIARAGQKLRIFVRNKDGADLGNLEVEFAGQKMTFASSPIEIDAPNSDGTYAIQISRHGFASYSTSITVESDKSWIVLLAAIIIAIIGIIAYVKFFYKKPLKSPSTEQK
jgi:outer membrane protein assembly factor BamB